VTENCQVCWFIRGYPHAAALFRKRAVYRTFIANVGKPKKEISKIKRRLEEDFVTIREMFPAIGRFANY